MHVFHEQVFHENCVLIGVNVVFCMVKVFNLGYDWALDDFARIFA